MSKLWIREYKAVPRVRSSAGGTVPAVPASGVNIAQEPGTDQAPVTFTTAQQSEAFGSDTRYVTIISDTAFHFVLGADPTATTSNLKAPADTWVSFGVEPGHKLSVVAAA